MDPAEEIREAKRQKDDINMLRYVCDSQYGIPRRCFCGSSIIDEVRANDTIDTLPGRRFFTCKNYEVKHNIHILLLVIILNNLVCICWF